MIRISTFVFKTSGFQSAISNRCYFGIVIRMKETGQIPVGFITDIPMAPAIPPDITRVINPGFLFGSPLLVKYAIPSLTFEYIICSESR